MNIIFNVILTAVALVGTWFGYSEAQKPPTVGANTLISALTTGTSLDDADHIIYNDNSGVPTTKKITVANATSSLQTWFSGLYSPIFSTSAGLASLLSDETGSGGGFVRATSPTVTTPTINSPTFDVAGTDATGDIYYNGGSGLFTRLGIGSAGQYLYASSTGVPEWDNSHLLTNPQTASSTFAATTSIEASNINNKALILNGLAYSWPSSRGNSTKQFLTDNGTGVLTFASSSAYFYGELSGTYTATSGTNVIFATTTLPANTITTNMVLRGSINLTIVDGSTVPKTLSLKIGGNTCASSGGWDMGGGQYDGILSYYILATSSASQVFCSFDWKGHIYNTGALNSGYGFTGNGILTGTINTSATGFSLEMSQNSAGDTETAKTGYLEVVKM